VKLGLMYFFFFFKKSPLDFDGFFIREWAKHGPVYSLLSSCNKKTYVCIQKIMFVAHDQWFHCVFFSGLPLEKRNE
jgi:hypothetical protein